MPSVTRGGFRTPWEAVRCRAARAEHADIRARLGVIEAIGGNELSAAKVAAPTVGWDS